jgi:hypothetical protein
VDIARRMVDAGSARVVMGNHEFNAIAWYLDDPDKPGEHLRPRTGEIGEKNRHQHAAFLAAVGEDSALHRELVEWFLTLPLWLDLPELRVVHACWHPAFMDWLRPRLGPGHTLDRDLVAAASRSDRDEFTKVEALTKGLEAPLPDGHAYHDKDGIERRRVRVRWWDEEATSIRELALLDDARRAQLPDVAPEDYERPADADPRPVFFGHYWMTGAPKLLAPTVACVDYSAAKGGDLVAYRWEGEATLDAARFVSVGGER